MSERERAYFDYFYDLLAGDKHADERDPKRLDACLPAARGIEGLRKAGAANLGSRLISGSGEFLPVEAPAPTCEALRAFRAELGHAA